MMQITSQVTSNIARQFRELHFGVNWTWSNLKEQLLDVSWEEATTRIGSLNTILTLAFHINYYISGLIPVFEGSGKLEISDKYAFDSSGITSAEDWTQFLEKCWADGERFAGLIEQLPESRLWETFFDKKYGNYYRNLHGMIEHSHYHLGQIVVIKKMIREKGTL